MTRAAPSHSRLAGIYLSGGGKAMAESQVMEKVALKAGSSPQMIFQWLQL